MGLFDLPAPLFRAVDGAVAGALPATVRLWLWGLIGGVASMGLYWLLSPQKRIGQTKRELAQAQQALNSFDGEFAQAWPMLRRMLGLAFKQLGIVFIPALIAMSPVLCLLAWMSTSFSYRWPQAGAEVPAQTEPSGYGARWNAQPRGAEIVILDRAGRTLSTHTMAAPVPVLHKRQWWNALLGNPAGYLDDSSPVETVEFDLPDKEYLGFGPGWLRGWEFSFLLAVTIGAVGLKLGFHIE